MLNWTKVTNVPFPDSTSASFPSPWEDFCFWFGKWRHQRVSHLFSTLCFAPSRMTKKSIWSISTDVWTASAQMMKVPINSFPLHPLTWLHWTLILCPRVKHWSKSVTSGTLTSLPQPSFQSRSRLLVAHFQLKLLLDSLSAMCLNTGLALLGTGLQMGAFSEVLSKQCLRFRINPLQL